MEIIYNKNLEKKQLVFADLKIGDVFQLGTEYETKGFAFMKLPESDKAVSLNSGNIQLFNQTINVILLDARITVNGEKITY